MSDNPAQHERLAFLSRVVGKQAKHLKTTTDRLFLEPLTIARLHQLDSDAALGEQVEAFTSRFCRLQDTIGDKLLPAYLAALGETPGAAIDNLDRAERLGLINSVDNWMELRRLRNQMVHEYVEDIAILADALATAGANVTMLITAAEHICNDLVSRGWI